MATPLTEGMAISRPVAGGAFFLEPDTNLRLSALNSAAGVTLLCSGQILTLDGFVVPFQQTFIPATDRSLTSAIFVPGCGWLLDAQIVASAGTPRRGQCYARLELIRGREGATHAIGTVLQGYVQDTSALAFPGSAIEDSTSGRGVLRSITGTNPAAGVEIVETVPANARWRVIAFTAVLVTDATVANRFPSFRVDDGANLLFYTLGEAAQTAGQTINYVWAPIGITDGVAGSPHQIPMPPDLQLVGGMRLFTVTSGIVAGDNWGAPQYLVEEWIED